jgi:hypothetical protein
MWQNNTEGRARLARGRVGLVDDDFGTRHMGAARKAIRIKDMHKDFTCTARRFSCRSREVVPQFPLAVRVQYRCIVAYKGRRMRRGPLYGSKIHKGGDVHLVQKNSLFCCFYLSITDFRSVIGSIHRQQNSMH